MSDITDFLDLQECSQIPDHSVLQAVIKREASVPHNTLLKFPTNLKRIPNKPKSYQIPNDFLNDDNAREKIEQTINKIENALADRRDVDEAYSNLFQLINSEVISKIGHKSAHDDQHKITSRKSKYKPYWNENLQEYWKNACEQEKNLLKYKICLPNGNISKDINIVYETWKNEYEHLFNTSDGEYDEGFLTFIQQQVDHDLVNNIENNSDTLNSRISYEDVEKSVYRAKLNKSTGCGSSPRSNFGFTCGNTVVKYDSKYRYLGMWIDEHLDWKFTVREVRKSASRALSALYTKFIACGGMDFDIYEKLYENLVQPVLLYGSSIWGISEHKQLETVQNRACRYFLGAFKNSTNLAVRGLFFKLSNLEDDRIVRTIHETSKTKQRSWHSRVLALLRKSELNFLINLNITTKQKLRMAQDKLTAIDQEKWLIDVFDDKNYVNGNKLRTFRSGTTIISAHHKPEADGKFGNQINDETMFSISIAECDMRCSLNPRCVSFFYNSLTKLCILHSNPFTYTVLPNSGIGWRLYVTRDRTGRCPDNFFFYRQLDFCCYQFRPSIKAAYITCPLGKLQRIDTEEKQNYTRKITADIELVYNAAICIQGTNTGSGWKFLVGTLMTYKH
ncbi:unnamed protein product [Mytilus edulis]|uniref:Apple domain-containing protein n=1 Tax=Mytilus edulis TaxID=6550 RepID=A0A8S3T6L2_MYTED|nr:unnamed protein product [Mytilus edulis]